MEKKIKKIWKESRPAIKAARRVLKRWKWRRRLSSVQREKLSGALKEMREALRRNEPQAARTALKKLNGLLDNNFSSARKGPVREWIESIAFALVLVFLVRTFIVQPFKIPTGSMEPTLLGVKKECPICRQTYPYDQKNCSRDGSRLRVTQTGDKILVNKFIYGAKTPDRIPFTPILLPYLSLPKIRKPSRGDIVVFHFPEGLEKDYVKRLAGLPGETIEISGGRVLIDGRPVSVPEMNKVSYTNRGPFGERGRKVLIPAAGSSIPLEPADRWLWEPVVRAEGHTVELSNGRILIDGKPRKEYTVEQDYYYVLGDNSPNSLDSRAWGFVPKPYLVGEVFFIYWPPGRWGPVR